MNVLNGVSLKNVPFYGFRRRNNFYYDNLCMLDIEVSTGFLVGEKLIPFNRKMDNDFWDDKEKFSLLYLWNIAIDGYLFTGRCLDDLLNFLNGLNDLIDGTLFIYIHNASYEFQFLRNILDDINVFARKKRKPLKFNWKQIEFRCSYMLTRLSLDNWSAQKKLEVRKLVGTYDYSKLRTPLTHLDVNERDYGYHDVLVGVAGLKEYRERFKHIKDIPLTQTSCIRYEVQKVLKKETFWKEKVSAMTDIPLEMYQFLIDCFAGGYTHANALYANRVINSLLDFDISSSYPWAMLSEKYPITPFLKETDNDEIKRIMNHYNRYSYCLEIEMTQINSRYFNTYISASKCLEIDGGVFDNGRVISADRIVMRCLDVDYLIIQKAYEIGKTIINTFYYARKGYLDREYCLYIVQLFKHKTTLKNNEEMYDLMFKSKEEINGLYGMGVTKDITDEITYDALKGWDKDDLTEEKYYEKVYKKSRNLRRLTLAYAQGIYVPAYGRNNLWKAIFALDDLEIYSDTDSIKAVSHPDVITFMDEYNKDILKKHEEVAKRLRINVDDLSPTDHKGEKHYIGSFERDEDINRFKTLGAKRYVCEYDMSRGLDYLKMTVSGVRKKAVYQLNSIEDFGENLVFDVENAEKLMLIYNDNQSPIMWNKGKYDEWYSHDKYGIAAYNITYAMTMNQKYLSLIEDVLNDYTKIFRRIVSEKR